LVTSETIAALSHDATGRATARATSGDANLCGGSDPIPANDSAADAIFINRSETSASGTTRGASDDGAGTCGGEGPDVWFFTSLFDGQTTLIVTVTPDGSPGFMPVVRIHFNGATGPELACGAASAPGEAARALATGVDGTSGFFYIVVDSATCAPGGFSLSLTRG
jgi:hypothetical protein